MHEAHNALHLCPITPFSSYCPLIRGSRGIIIPGLQEYLVSGLSSCSQRLDLCCLAETWPAYIHGHWPPYSFTTGSSRYSFTLDPFSMFIIFIFIFIHPSSSHLSLDILLLHSIPWQQGKLRDIAAINSTVFMLGQGLPTDYRYSVHGTCRIALHNAWPIAVSVSHSKRRSRHCSNAV